MDEKKKLQNIQNENGDIITVEKGTTLEELELKRRGPKLKWPFSQRLADIICKKIVEGSSMEKVCEEEGIPGRYVISKWRHENPNFDSQMIQARKDRAEYFFDKAVATAENATRETIAQDTLKVGVYRWAAQISAPESFGNGNKSKVSNNDPKTIFVINTGIDRRPFSERSVNHQHVTAGVVQDSLPRQIERKE